MVLGRTLRGDKQENGLKFASPTSRGSSNGGNGTSTPKKKWEAKSRKFESGERSESLAEGNRGLKSLNFDKKRKKSDAGMITNEGRDYDQNAGRPKRKSITIVRKDKRGDNIGEEKQTTKEKPYKFERSTQNASFPGRNNYRQMEFMDKRKSGASVMTKSMKDEGVCDKPQKSSRSKFKVTNQSEQEEISPGRTSMKRRRIRIDRYDTSNKRLDDGIADNNSVQKREEDSKSSEVKLSQNAQFRAIVPSPSILSFVEDNLLGRRREIEFRRAGYNIELSAPLDNIPHSSSSERERIEEPVFRNKLTFFAAAKISSSFPPPELPEIAFAGRSNVGKSSLLNALTRQWGVVRTSDKPGLTQTINFFQLASKLCLVDLPGYGFAYAKEEVKEAWEELVKEYVSTRVGLKRVCLLVDTKWGMKPRDHELIDLMERSQTKYQIVLTKTDVVFPIDVARRAMQIEESLKAKKLAVQPVMMVSSKTGAGIRSLRTALTKIARFVKP